MYAMWINGNHYKEINTLDLWDVKDLTEQRQMMDKSSRDPHNTKGSNIHTNPCEDTSKVLATPYCSVLSSTQKPLTSLPLISSSPSLTALSTSTTQTAINPLTLFFAVELELEDCFAHPISDDGSNFTSFHP